MSRESWLFLFAMLSGIGGAIPLVQFLFRVVLMIRKEQSENISLSKQRALMFSALLMLSLGLSVTGFVSSLRRKPPHLFQQWGWTPPNKVYATVDTSQLLGDKNRFLLLLVCRIYDPAVDLMMDDRIEKSAPFVISGDVTEIEISLRQAFLDRAAFKTWVEIYLLEVPPNVRSEQIFRLSDLNALGGKSLSRVLFTMATGGRVIVSPRRKQS